MIGDTTNIVEETKSSYLRLQHTGFGNLQLQCKCADNVVFWNLHDKEVRKLLRATREYFDDNEDALQWADEMQEHYVGEIVRDPPPEHAT